ncbi:precorrin-2 dehydrogenase/sirohydrochlorin ferrochelatase family protein [Desulfovibrio legallii]|jgi:precorrin-2 dehydrogenase/sirohydrochlorin ferrochelatase|uniref:precorrin-2 dehydrogenase n=1 Tax=Desulfovibrio legallii TaxID=571438 RepID=A0A1G7JUI9_9BACT|nr:bifunctional precorrin-2 dehydrogenase/sirohydrochlorin ferrochelatase [Desulfovibrio legallii]SDF28578.1 precorrin-2 dehydrogenase [Desulfovibrio legallii]
MTHDLLYPVFLSLAGCRCLVAGLGNVGQRKLAGLLACGPAAVLALDTAPPPAAAAPLLNDARVRFARRACTAEDIAGCALVFAATGDVAENRRVAALCRRAGVLCNCASAPEEGGFQVPSVARRPPLAAALSTGGASPALARRWKGELEAWLAPRARMAALMARLRPLVLALGQETGQNTLLFRKLAASPLQIWLERDETDRCRQWLLAELPPALHAHLAELLHDLP